MRTNLHVGQILHCRSPDLHAAHSDDDDDDDDGDSGDDAHATNSITNR
jgi:hypothetical protein